MTAPVRAWLRGPLPPFAEDLLSRDRLRDKGYFAPDAVRALLDRHRREANAPHITTLLGILAIQTWDELFVRGRDPHAFA